MQTPSQGKQFMQAGFSLVEMLVAIAFTAVLMAGMSKVFKSSLSVFVSSSETVSSNRRNRMALDLLSDDLNLAGLYLTQLDQYPTWVQPNNPGFWIEPGADAATPDQLHFAFDDALPIDAQLSLAGATTTSNASLVQSRASLSELSTKILLTTQADQASQIKSGMYLVFKDTFDVKQIDLAKVTGGSVEIDIKESIAGSTGAPSGSTGKFYNVVHRDKAPVLIVRPAQQVRYSIQQLVLDTVKDAPTIPCLVREISNYGTEFKSTEASYSTTIVAENVPNFKLFLSVDSGATWLTGTSWTDVVTKLNAALAAIGRQGYTNITGNAHWYRDIPVLVRIDLTTQTVKAREEYATTPGTLSRKLKNETLVMLPRHFGLSYYQ